jgi:hypothetical protein
MANPRTPAKKTLRSEDLVRPDLIKLLDHVQRVDQWRNWAAIGVTMAGFSAVCAAIFLPWPYLEPFRDKAWTVLTIMIGGAGTYLFSRKSDR